MKTTSTNRFRTEAAFRDHVVDVLWEEGIPTMTERFIPKDGERHPLMRTDILIGRYPQSGCEATIECKISADSQSLCTGLGQALIYRQTFDADRSVICFPQDVAIPHIFLEVCDELGVGIASERTIFDVVDPNRTLRDGDCFGPAISSLRDFKQRLGAERFEDWSEEALRTFQEKLQWFADTHRAIQHQRSVLAQPSNGL